MCIGMFSGLRVVQPCWFVQPSDGNYILSLDQ